MGHHEPPTDGGCRSRILFLDWDGVVRPFGDLDGDGVRTNLGRLAVLGEVPGIKVVVTSTRRLMSDDPGEVVGPGFPLPLHDDWRTRVGPGSGERARDISEWLGRHPEEVDVFVALDDVADGCPDDGHGRLVLCDPVTGVTDEDVRDVMDILSGR